MVLRAERQRELLLASINACQYPGQVVEEIVALKAELLTATIQGAVPPNEGNGNGTGDAAPTGEVAGVRHTP